MTICALLVAGTVEANSRSFITYNGKKFYNTREFVDSEEFQQLRFEQQMKKRHAEWQREKAVEFGRNIRRFSGSSVYWINEQMRSDNFARSVIGEDRWKMLKQPEFYDEQSMIYQLTKKVGKRHGVDNQTAWEMYPEEILQEMKKLDRRVY